MEGLSLFEDEVIADSEGEDDFFAPVNRARTTGNDSNVSQFTANPNNRDPVANFTPITSTKASTIENASSSSAGPPARPRPRPKPAYKSAQSHQADSSVSNGTSESSEVSKSRSTLNAEANSVLLDFAAVPSIADRAKMRRRDTKATPTSTPLDFTPPSKSNAISKKNSPIEVLEITSDEDELALEPAPTKKKRKSKVATSNNKTPKSPARRSKGVQPPPQADSSQPSLPMATSPVLPAIPLTNTTMPPSDPPPSTPLEHPPIAVMPKLPGDQGSSSRATSLSPSKRKRSSERDELEGEDMSMDIDKQLMPPPPVVMIPSTKKPAKARKTKEKKDSDDAEGGGKKKTASKKAAKEAREKKTKDKGKGKVKEPEVFKSAEFVDDDDVDDLFGDERPASSSTGGAPATSSSPRSRQKSSEPSTRPEPVEIEEVEPPRKKQKTDKRTQVESDVSAKKRKQNVVMSDEEDVEEAEEVVTKKRNGSSKKTKAKSSKNSSDEVDHIDQELPGPLGDSGADALPKENVDPKPDTPAPAPAKTTVDETPSKPTYTPISSRYSVAPRTKSTPMSELIRKVNAQPNSPFHSPAASASKQSAMGTAYSPYLKSSKSMLSRIAPLHPNRRPPPPPLPPPPPKKKTKKELEREEKWEEELVESVGGLTEWAALSEQERKDMRRMKREQEMYGYDD
ncbi:hypothetical protein V5O48_002946 [Marasmius crinis-equi]|uniref:Uncharacterized protein n=1 Tax=Marasmius crinis-equi TaxID=585013 RepID=A0ABR3FU72_9AGAR